MFRICKKFAFEAAHQLEVAYSEACMETIHGHSYVVELFLVSDVLDEMGMVLDFGYLKNFIKEVKKEYDHALILPKKDWLDKEIPRQKKVVLLEQNPTAEYLAKLIYNDLEVYWEGLSHQWPPDRPRVMVARIEKVRVHETASGWAEFSGEE